MSSCHDELKIMIAVMQWCHKEQFDSKPTDDDDNDDHHEWYCTMMSPGAGQQTDCSDFSQFHSKPSRARKYTLPPDHGLLIQLLDYVIPLPPPPLSPKSPLCCGVMVLSRVRESWRGSHSLSAEGTKDEVKQTQSEAQGQTVSTASLARPAFWLQVFYIIHMDARNMPIAHTWGSSVLKGFC